jgi:hypothetical protein
MKIGVLGTGMVGSTIGSRLIELGHEVCVGSRSPTNTRAVEWAHENGTRARSGTFADAAAFGGMVVNCTRGAASLEALEAAGRENLKEKIVVDLANPLGADHPGALLFCNNESLGERIQAAFPEARVVKTLNTMWCGLMVKPRRLPEPHTVYVGGNDAAAKAEVIVLLRSFGWQDDEIMDLGDISTARGTEMILPLWLQLSRQLGTSEFNFKVVRKSVR